MSFGICPYALARTARRTDDLQLALFGPGCNNWKCEVCGKRKKFMLIKKILTAAPNRFLTLTCRHEGTPDEQLALMRTKMQKLFEKLRQKHGKIEYLRMLEQCKDEYPHFHFLIRSSFIPQPEIKDLWSKLTGAKIVDIRKAHGKSSGYVAKYLGKACSKTGEFSRQRIAVSKSFWPKNETNTAEDWGAWKAESCGPVLYAEQNQNEYSFTDRNSLSWYMNERQPGDELPTSLTPAEQEPWRNDN